MKSRTQQTTNLRSAILQTAITGLLLVTLAGNLMAQGTPESREPIGQFLTLKSPIDEQVVSQVVNASLRLQADAERESTDAFLILELEPGSSSVGRILDLARHLTSPEINRVRTVAWVPKSLNGLPVLVAMMCDDIIVAPRAKLSGVNEQASLSVEERGVFLALSRASANSRVPEVLVSAMMDPSVAIYRVRIETGGGQSETRFLSREAVQKLQSGNEVIEQTEVVKEAGAELSWSGEQALNLGLIVTTIARDRAEIAKIYGLPLESMREPRSQQSPSDAVAMIELNRPLNATLADFAAREMRNAAASGATTVIFRLQSNGGDMESAQSLAVAISEMKPEKLMTVAWVPAEARGYAALVAMACDKIVLHKDATVGDIASSIVNDLTVRPEDKADRVRRLDAFMVNLAEQKQKTKAFVRAMANPELTVFEVRSENGGQTTWMTPDEIEASAESWIKGEPLKESVPGEALILTADRAFELGVSEAPCTDQNELRTRLGLGPMVALTPVATTWVDGLVFFLNSGMGAFLLIAVGVIALYFELHFPSGFFAIISVTCFSLFFWSRFLGGTAGTLELVLFLLGIGLLAMEFFVVPGFGICGISGILLTCVSLIMASYTFAGLSAGESFETSLRGLGTLTAALVTVIIVAVAMNQFLPSIPWVRNLILTPPGYAPADSRSAVLNPSLLRSSTTSGPVNAGERGMAASVLRPSGKATFGDKFLDVVSDGGFIEHGTPIEVLRVSGNRIVVRPVQEL